jgi:hypothetical protein
MAVGTGTSSIDRDTGSIAGSKAGWQPVKPRARKNIPIRSPEALCLFNVFPIPALNIFHIVKFFTNAIITYS